MDLRARSSCVAGALAVVLSTGLATGACNLFFGIEEGRSTTSTGGAGGTSMTSTGGTGAAAGSTLSSGGTTGSGGTTSTGGTTGSGGTGGTTTMSTGGGGAAPTLHDGLVLLLHLDEDSWGAPGDVLDSSGQGNHGTATGTATPTLDGKLGGAGSFDGSGWIVVPDTQSLHVKSQLTCAAWVYPTSLTDGAGGYPNFGVVSKREAYQVNQAYTLFVWDSNNAYVDIQNDRFHTVAKLTNGQWVHLALVYDGDAPQALRTRLYVNGLLDSLHPAIAALDPNTQDIQVGGLPGGGDPFQGKLDEVTLWTRALSDQEIQTVYQNGVF